MRCFLAVVDHGGVHRAAAHLHLAQPSVSQSVKTLERDLGVELFHRTGRALRPTAAGMALVGPAREVCHDLELARASVEAAWGAPEGGHLLVAVTPSQAVDPLAGLLSTLARRRPGVRTRVIARPTIEDVVEALRVGDAEVGIAAARDHRYRSTDFVVDQVTTQGFVVVGRDWTVLPAEPCRPDALPGAGLVVGQAGSGMRRAADEILASSPASHIVVEVEHREAMLPLVAAGLGVAIVAEALRPLAQDMGLCTVRLATEHVLHIELLRRRGVLSPVARAFCAVAVAGAEVAIPATARR